MKKLFLGMLIILSLCSCSKNYTEDMEGGKCYFACLISDKYTGDSVFVVRDTLWLDNCLTEYWWLKTRAASDTLSPLFRHCNPFYRNGKLVELERMFYVLDKNKNIPPLRF